MIPTDDQKPPTLDDFRNRPTQKTGLRAWLRSIPFDEPQLLPEGLMKTERVSSRLSHEAEVLGVYLRPLDRADGLWIWKAHRE